MTQERAELNWYHKPPDYYAARDRTASSAPADETREIHSAQQAKAGTAHDTEAGEFTFDDFLDIINPLHHLPVISSIYREVTGDQISAHARILGGGLYGGATGFVSSIANAISEEASGRDLGENLVAAVFGEDEGGSDVLVAKGRPVEAPEPGPSDLPATAQSGGKTESRPVAVGTNGAPPLADAKAVAASTSQTLTGDAALSALIADVKLRGPGEKTVTSALPVSAGPGLGPTVFDPSLYASPGTTAEAGSSEVAGEPGFADRMLLGLQKYEEMVRHRPIGPAHQK